MKTQWIARFFTAAGLAGMLLSGALAHATTGDPAVSDYLEGTMIVPFEGFLTRDSRPISGSVLFRIELWDSPTELDEDLHLKYAESQEVTAQNGIVSVGIGSGSRSVGNLRDTVLDGERLWLQIGIEETPDSVIPLAQRQPIEVAPYSAWSNDAADMSVAGSLSVGGDVICTGALGAADATASGRVDARSISTNGNVTSAQHITAEQTISTPNSISAVGNITAASGDAAARFVRASGVLGAASLEMVNIFGSSAHVSNLPIGLSSLTLVARDDGAPEFQTALQPQLLFSDGARDPGLQIDDAELAVTDGGNLSTSGDLEASGNAHGTCDWTGWIQRSNTFSGSVPTGSNYNRRMCPNGRFMARIDFAHRNNEHDAYQEYYRIECCAL